MALPEDTHMQSAKLLSSVAEQLRLLLLQVARASELALVEPPTVEQLQAMQRSSQIGLQLVEHYLLGLEYYEKQIELTLEPVSLSSLLHEVTHELSKVAASYNTELELYVGGKYPPVLADRAALKAALASLGYGIIVGGSEHGVRNQVQLAVHRTPRGIVAGVYGDMGIPAEALERGRKLYGKAQQPITGMAPASGAGIFVADTLLSAMGSGLRNSRFQKRLGLGATLQVSGQMQFV